MSRLTEVKRSESGLAIGGVEDDSGGSYHSSNNLRVDDPNGISLGFVTSDNSGIIEHKGIHHSGINDQNLKASVVFYINQ